MSNTKYDPNWMSKINFIDVYTKKTLSPMADEVQSERGFAIVANDNTPSYKKRSRRPQPWKNEIAS